MKSIMFISLLGLTLTLESVTLAADQSVLYVSPSGNDSWSGIEKVNAAKSDGPLATLEAAVEKSRNAGEVSRRILLAEGRYFLKGMLALDKRDKRLSIEGAGQGKTIIYGGRQLTGWTRIDDRMWSASLPPEMSEASFRVLVANDRILARARYPEKGYLEHETKFPVRWMSSAGGGWERKPTMEEYTKMVYREGDIPKDLRIENAEITICHMWDESTLPVAGHDVATRTITFKSQGIHPPGAFNKNGYVIWNTREGMTRPGQWYLDKVEKKVYYRPCEGEDMSSISIIAPVTVKIISLERGKGNRAENVTIRDLTVSAGDAPMTQSGFGASNWPGVIDAGAAKGVVVERVEVQNSGVWGVRGADMQIKDCHFHHIGGGGIKYWGGALVEGNHIHDIGLVSANSLGINGGGKGSIVRRNVIHDTPYSGMAIGGTETLIEENELYRCMQVHHDGAAIYMGGGQQCTIRRNLARDMVEVGKGYGVSAYYLDEKCQGCVVAENIAIDVPHPSQNHMTLNCELRDNVFICKGDMKIAFSRCSGHKVTGNKFHLEGKLNVYEPDAITEWTNNLIFAANDKGGQVLDDFEHKPFTARDKPLYFKAVTVDKPPLINGKMDDDEWPSGGRSLGERPNQHSVRGAPTSVKITADKTGIYILVNVVSMFPPQRKLGKEWGKDEGIELVIEQNRDGKKILHTLHGFTDGTLKCVQAGGSAVEDSEAFARCLSYAAGVEKQLWRSEWAIPFSALGMNPSENLTIPFNITVYRSEDDVYAQFAGTLGETWDLQRGGRLTVENVK